MRSCVMVSCVVCSAGCPFSEEVPVFPEKDVVCAETFHEALPEEPVWFTEPEFQAVPGNEDTNQGVFGRLKVEPPYEASGPIRYYVSDDGAVGLLDIEQGLGFEDGFQFLFLELSHWCADGTYIAMAKTDILSVTLFGHFREARDDEHWFRHMVRTRVPPADTVFQVMDVAAYDCAYESGEDEAWHTEHCNLLTSGTMHRRQ